MFRKRFLLGVLLASVAGTLLTASLTGWVPLPWRSDGPAAEARTAVLAGSVLSPLPEPPASPLAAAPGLVNFQGLLTDAATGLPVADGSYSVRFSIWHAASGPSEVWNETQNVTTEGGLFSVLLGSVTPLTKTVFAGDPRYLEVKVGGDPPMTPRQRFATVPYAFFAEEAHELGSLRVELNGTSPNLIGGYSGNSITSGAQGAAIGGGGDTGSTNRITDDYGTVSGGGDNQAGDNAGTTTDRTYATVGGGESNEASGERATVCGGGNNTASGNSATVSGGGGNTASTDFTTVGGGQGNIANSQYNTVSGGYTNTASGYDSATVAGGQSNTASGGASAVGGDMDNAASGSYATVGGGRYNQASGERATVAGGYANIATDDYATVAGGYGNQAGDNAGTTADAQRATVGGGFLNTASALYAGVGGGVGNTASAEASTVGGGYQNAASGGESTVGGGEQNIAGGSYATVPGGNDNSAAGDYSFAAGRRAGSWADGCFVWGDSTDVDVWCSVANGFVVRATGGTWFYSAVDAFGNGTAGVQLAAGGGSWSSISDRDLKENLTPVDGQQVLTRLADIPISTWNYESQDSEIRHMGPAAQDLYAAFGLGEDERYISTVDADGVALAAIQGLYELVQERDAEIAAQEERIAALEDAAGENDSSAGALSSGLSTTGLIVVGLLLAGAVLVTWVIARKALGSRRS